MLPGGCDAQHRLPGKLSRTVELVYHAPHPRPLTPLNGSGYWSVGGAGGVGRIGGVGGAKAENPPRSVHAADGDGNGDGDAADGNRDTAHGDGDGDTADGDGHGDAADGDRDGDAADGDIPDRDTPHSRIPHEAKATWGIGGVRGVGGVLLRLHITSCSVELVGCHGISIKDRGLIHKTSSTSE